MGIDDAAAVVSYPQFCQSLVEMPYSLPSSLFSGDHSLNCKFCFEYSNFLVSYNMPTPFVNHFDRYRYDMTIEEAAELARRSIYHATFRDGASGGTASGKLTFPLRALVQQFVSVLIVSITETQIYSNLWCYLSVYYVGPDGWKKLSGDDVGELHYKYYPVEPAVVEQEMTEVSGA